MSDSTFGIIIKILISLMIIVAVDVSTPLGFSVWILYFIPLFLTLYWDERNGPFYITGIIIVLIAASFFLSPQDISPLYALLNRVFFSGMLIASAFLIWNHKKSEENLKKNEKNYRILTEWSPDAVIVYREGAIRYANRAFLHLFDRDPPDPLLAGIFLISFSRNRRSWSGNGSARRRRGRRARQRTYVSWSLQGAT